MTSWVRAAAMIGKTAGYMIAQFIILFHIGTYRTTIFISLCIFCVTTVFCFLMLRVSWKQIVEKIAAESSKAELQKVDLFLPNSYREYMVYRLKKLKSDFISIYSNFAILKWCFWWAMSTCMVMQINVYGQTLLGELQLGDDIPLNGFADATYTFTATILIILMSYLPLNWNRWGEAILVLVCIIEGTFLFIFSQTDSVYIMYFCYIFYRSFCQVVLVIAQWNIAKNMVADSHGLFLGVNYFTGICMQSILTGIVNDKRGFGMPVREAFIVYAGLHAFISVVFSISVVYDITLYCGNKSKVKFTESTSKIVTGNSHSLPVKAFRESSKTKNNQGSDELNVQTA